MPVASKKIQLFLITGFLGAGKTTFLNNILKDAGERKTGIIINEFGQINVDAELVDNKGDEITELNNGSIFCSCLAGSFIKSILKYEELPVEFLFVESSGLAKPGSIEDIINEVKKRSDRFVYRGMVCLIDSLQFLKLVDNVKAIYEQVQFSDRIIINKTDLVSEKVIENIGKKLKEINSQATTYRAKFGEINENFFRLKSETEKKKNLSPSRCEGRNEIRIINIRLNNQAPIATDKILHFLNKILNYTYRIKGFLPGDEGLYHIDSVDDNLKVRRLKTNDKVGLTIIPKSNITKNKIKKAWEKYIENPITFE